MERQTINSEGGLNLSFLVADQTDGQGPLLVFCHGFPGLGFSWRHQLSYFARRGYLAVALDMRGYGDSDAPDAIADYSLDHIRADLLAVLAHFGKARAVFAGHDFGAPVVWNMALHEPECVAGLVVLSVPYDHDYYGRRGLDAASQLPSALFAEVAQTHFLHAHYFQRPGVAEGELDEQSSTFLRRLFWALSAEGDLLSAFAASDSRQGYIDALPPVEQLLPWRWLSRAEFAVYAEAFSRTGFRGPLNWYRVADINWRLNARYLGQSVTAPVCFMAGSQDPVIAMSGEACWDFMRKRVPDLRRVELIPQAGHWVQQEQPGAVNSIMEDFLRSLSLDS